MGFDQPKSLGARETGGGVAMPIWLDYMGDMLKGVPEQKEHPRPDGLLVERGDFYFSEFPPGQAVARLGLSEPTPAETDQLGEFLHDLVGGGGGGDNSIQIGLASCRERVCQYVSVSVVAVTLK